MASDQARRTGELQRMLFEALKAHPQGLQAKDALEKIARTAKMTDFEAGEYSPGVRRFEKIVRFATVSLVKAGWMTKTKGIWALTEAGVKAYERHKDPTAFRQESLKLYYQWRKSKPENFADAADTEAANEEVDQSEVFQKFERSEEEAWSEIRTYLRQVDPYELQSMVAGLLKAMGYHLYFEAPPGPDGGIDIIAFADPLGSKPPRIKVQVKREASAMAPEQVRSFMSLIGDGEVGIFLNVGGFSRNTHEEARKQMTRQVTLIDDEGFFDLWVKHYAALEDVYKQKMPIRPIFFLAPSN